MTHYVDGFVVPIPLRNVDAYRSMSEICGKLWKEHGALQSLESIGDDAKPVRRDKIMLNEILVGGRNSIASTQSPPSNA